MGRKQVSEFRGMPEGELRERIVQTRKSLETLRVKASQGALEQPHQIQTMRRDVARMLTILKEQAGRKPGSA